MRTELWRKLLPWLAGILLAGLPGHAGAAAAAPRTIVFFGDSLTAGYGLDDPGTEAYPALIQRKAEASAPGWRVVNAGLSGETSAGGLRRIDWMLRQPVHVFVLALGANDGLRGLSPDVTKANLQQILDRVRAKNPRATLVVAGMEMPPSYGSEFTAAFRKIFPELAAKNGATLVPFLLDGVGGVAALNLPDRIHPNPAGHRKVAENIWTVVGPLLRQKPD
ncbi:MAG: arylesterase [Opitutia bacterium Tous-C1TDCM]|nr:MAG: arylesterase [Opitutae bacterium Tous-C1TDCM]